MGAAPLFTIGTAYLDEIVHPKYVSVHLGVFYMIVVVGPALGYGLGGAFLSVYVDPTEDTLLEPSDPGWVGAWWLCFVFSGVVSILISVPFFFFPRRLPNSEAIKKARVQEMARSYSSRFQSTDPDETDFGSIVKSFPTHLKQVSVSLRGGGGIFLPPPSSFADIVEITIINIIAWSISVSIHTQEL